jgi:hypothetical protein
VIFSEAFKNETGDIAVATLFFHHFTHQQLIEIVIRLKQQTRLGYVVNDLHGNPLAFYSIKLLTKMFSKSAMVKYDAPLSVLRGFSKAELVDILKQAGIEQCSLKMEVGLSVEVGGA